MGYLNGLLQGLMKFEKNSLVKFHLLYSVIELFISKIFESEFKANLAQFQNPIDFYDAREKLTKLANEKDRINTLLSSKCPKLIQDLMQDLKVSCNSFLSFTSSSELFDKPPGEALYKVRSSIFHNYRLLPPGYEEKLDEVVLSLESIILDISIKLRL